MRILKLTENLIVLMNMEWIKKTHLKGCLSRVEEDTSIPSIIQKKYIIHLMKQQCFIRIIREVTF